MKVLYLNPSGRLGGAEWSLLNLLTGLKQHLPNFEPHVVVTEEGPLTAQCLQRGFSVEVLPFPRNLERLGDATVQGNRLQKLVRSAGLAGCALEVGSYSNALQKVVRRERPDLIHTNGFKMHLLGAYANGSQARLQSLPLIGHIHDYVSTRPVAGKLLKKFSSRFSCFIANSRSVASDVQEVLQSRKVVTVYNAIDTERYSPYGDVLDLAGLCGLPSPSGDSIRVGIVATFAKWKGHVTFLRALAKIDKSIPLQGFVIGAPIYRTDGSQFSISELKGEAERLGLGHRVGFTGFIEDTAKAIRALDLVVHASTSPEPFGMTIIEAMACEKPVVVSNVGGAAELFEEGVTGIGHRPGDEQDLAARIEALARDRDLRISLGVNARRSVHARFQLGEMAAHVAEIYSDALRFRSASACA